MPNFQTLVRDYDLRSSRVGGGGGAFDYYLPDVAGDGNDWDSVNNGVEVVIATEQPSAVLESNDEEQSLETDVLGGVDASGFGNASVACFYVVLLVASVLNQ